MRGGRLGFYSRKTRVGTPAPPAACSLGIQDKEQKITKLTARLPPARPTAGLAYTVEIHFTFPIAL